MTYASNTRRMVAMTIDQVIVTILAFVPIVGWHGTAMFDPYRPEFYAAAIQLQFSLAIIAFLYFALLPLLPWQATPGKRLLGLRLVDLESGGTMSIPASLSRAFVAGIGGVLFGLTWITLFWDKKKQGVHDMIARTVVISCLETSHEEAGRRPTAQRARSRRRPSGR